MYIKKRIVNNYSIWYCCYCCKDGGDDSLNYRFVFKCFTAPWDVGIVFLVYDYIDGFTMLRQLQDEYLEEKHLTCFFCNKKLFEYFDSIKAINAVFKLGGLPAVEKLIGYIN